MKKVNASESLYSSDKIKLNYISDILSYIEITPNNYGRIKAIFKCLNGEISDEEMLSDLKGSLECKKYDIQSDLQQFSVTMQEEFYIRYNLPLCLQYLALKLFYFEKSKKVVSRVTRKNITEAEKNRVKLKFIAHNPSYVSTKLSKRQFPTEIFKYLISNGLIKADAFEKYRQNSFGRKFGANLADILYENEISEESKDYKRFNRVNFAEIPNSKYTGVLYISNQWDRDSIVEFCEHIRKDFPDDIHIYTVFSAKDIGKPFNEIGGEETLFPIDVEIEDNKAEWIKNLESEVVKGDKKDEYSVDYDISGLSNEKYWRDFAKDIPIFKNCLSKKYK